jgi:hypothetical protein
MDARLHLLRAAGWLAAILGVTVLTVALVYWPIGPEMFNDDFCSTQFPFNAPEGVSSSETERTAWPPRVTCIYQWPGRTVEREYPADPDWYWSVSAVGLLGVLVCMTFLARSLRGRRRLRN